MEVNNSVRKNTPTKPVKRGPKPKEEGLNDLCRLCGTVQYRKWSPTANDTQNGPQVIPKVDRKWSRENLRNGMDFMGLITKKDWL